MKLPQKILKYGLSQKENFKKYGNYIFELFKILQCKTGNEFRKSQNSPFGSNS